MNLGAVQKKLPSVAFSLFRFWTKKQGLDGNLIIKNEQNLIQDLTRTITQAITNLNRRNDLSEKPLGWDTGFVIGFIDGHLGSHWFYEYVMKNSPEYKTLMGLKAIKSYLEFDEIVRIRIDFLYEKYFRLESNQDQIELDVQELGLNLEDMTMVPKEDRGKIQTILNNLILKQVEITTKFEQDFSLPVQDFLSIEEIDQLIFDNRAQATPL